MPYRIEYSQEAVEHLSSLTARQQSMVLEAVDAQLKHEPTTETRNRKPMRPNPLSTWELRIGTLRVYFDPQTEPEQVVFVRAIGIKQRNRLTIGGKAFEL